MTEEYACLKDLGERIIARRQLVSELVENFLLNSLYTTVSINDLLNDYANIMEDWND